MVRSVPAEIVEEVLRIAANELGKCGFQIVDVFNSVNPNLSPAYTLAKGRKLALKLGYKSKHPKVTWSDLAVCEGVRLDCNGANHEISAGTARYHSWVTDSSRKERMS
jgi:hypothetical protein